jgi:hypothetical protein
MRHCVVTAFLVLLGGCKGGSEVDCSLVDFTVIPSARGEVRGVWDTDRQRMVFFGGDQGVPQNCFPQTDFVGQTWSFQTDCDNFLNLSGPDDPPARGRYAAALDATRARMILHGGRWREGTSGRYTLYDDLWAFDLATDTWSELATGGPSARTNHIAVVAGDRFLLYGGNRSTDGASFIPLGDLWAFDLVDNEWSELSTSGATPGARLFHAGALSNDGGTLYVYGGGDENAFFGPFFGDLWALDLDQMEWTELHSGVGLGAPRGRIWADLLFDGPRNRLLLWAGHDDGALGNTNQLWAFDLGGGTWERLIQGDVLDAGGNGFCDFPADFVAPDLESPERRNAGVAVLTDQEELLVFGGKSDCGLLNDVWSLPLADGAWTTRSRATTGEICQRAFQECATLCF